eukprot:203696-Chlamydomonas_euryale.AAC.1
MASAVGAAELQPGMASTAVAAQLLPGCSWLVNCHSRLTVYKPATQAALVCGQGSIHGCWE